MPAEKEQGVGERGGEGGEVEQPFVSSEPVAMSVSFPGYTFFLLVLYFLIRRPEMIPPIALPATAGKRWAPASVLETR